MKLRHSSLLVALALLGCPTTNPPTDDTGMSMTDTPVTLRCPRMGVPNPDELTLPCCYRVSQEANTAAPELRLAYIDITQPAESPLAGATVGDLLNTTMREETFQWLFRGEGGEADGPVTITTGFGRRDATAGTYAFSTGTAPDMPEWAPVTLEGTLTGEVITTEPYSGTLTVPIFDEAMTTVQIELQLHAVRVVTSTFSENRSCIGTLEAPTRYATGATLGGFITVEEATAGMLMFPGIEASLCGVVAGDLTNAAYCTETAQGDWAVPPDAQCDDAGVCFRNGMGGTCDPAIADPDASMGGCNAWYLEASFAAHGVNID